MAGGDDSGPDAGHEETAGEALSQARVRSRRGLSWVWLAPLAAAGIVLWIAWGSLAERGPEITIAFGSAEGLQAGVSRIRHKGVDVGTVDRISLTHDMSQVLVRARIDRSAQDKLTRGTRFWIVAPRVSAGGISGLGTLVSGAYIEMYPGNGPPEREFVGLDTPPTLQPDAPGRFYTLLAGDVGAIVPGAPVTYRGLSIGEIEGYALDRTGEQVEIYVFVRSAFANLVHPSTRFWVSGAISVSSGARGMQVRLNSWQQLLTGAVALDTPAQALAGAPSPAGAVFRLYDDRGAALRSAAGPRLGYQLEFAQAQSGIEAGTAVELEGTEVGEVTSARLVYDNHRHALYEAVSIAIDPQTIGIVGSGTGDHSAQVSAAIDSLVEHGLRAQILTASYLTGEHIIALQRVHGAPAGHVRSVDGAKELPTAPPADVQEILANLQSTLANLDRATAGPGLAHAIANLDATMTHLQGITATLQPQVQPLIESLRAAAAAAQSAATAASSALGGGGRAGVGLPQLMEQLNEAAGSIRDLADYLNRHPESLLRGRHGGS